MKEPKKPPIPKKVMMARLKAEHAADGKTRRYFWLTDEDWPKVKKFVETLN